jgi:hypothetical protein
MTQRILYQCDAPGCGREVDEEGDLRVVERTSFDRDVVHVERRHACSAACEAAVLRMSAWRLLAAPSETSRYSDTAKESGALEYYVTPEGFTLLPADMREDLGVGDAGGVVCFRKVGGRWSAFEEGETAREVACDSTPHHLARTLSYLALFERRNLLAAARWSAPAARAAADGILREQTHLDRLVLLGAKVSAAFGVDFRSNLLHPRFVQVGNELLCGRWVLVLPHPSGRSREWNDPRTAELAREALAALRSASDPNAA